MKYLSIPRSKNSVNSSFNSFSPVYAKYYNTLHEWLTNQHSHTSYTYRNVNIETNIHKNFHLLPNTLWHLHIHQKIHPLRKNISQPKFFKFLCPNRAYIFTIVIAASLPIFSLPANITRSTLK